MGQNDAKQAAITDSFSVSASLFIFVLHPNGFHPLLQTIILKCCFQECVTQIGQQLQTDRERYEKTDADVFPDHLHVSRISPPPQCIQQILCRLFQAAAVITHSRSLKNATYESTQPAAARISLPRFCFSVVIQTGLAPWILFPPSQVKQI